MKKEEKAFQTVAQIVQQYCGVEIDQMSRNSDLIEIGVNQLDVSDLLVDIEQEFEATLPQEAYQKVRTIGDIMSYLNNY